MNNSGNSILSVAQTADVLKDVIRVFGAQDDEVALQEALTLAQRHMSSLYSKRSRLEEQRQALRGEVSQLTAAMDKFTEKEDLDKLRLLRNERDGYMDKIEALKLQETKMNEEYQKTQSILLKLNTSQLEFDHVFFKSLSRAKQQYVLYREISNFVFLDHDCGDDMKGSIHLSALDRIVPFDLSSSAYTDFEASNHIWDLMWTNYA